MWVSSSASENQWDRTGQITERRRYYICPSGIPQDSWLLQETFCAEHKIAKRLCVKYTPCKQYFVTDFACYTSYSERLLCFSSTFICQAFTQFLRISWKHVTRAGLKPMQPMQLHWAPRLWGPAPLWPRASVAPRHGVWVDGSFFSDTPCAWEFSRNAIQFHC